MGESSGCIRNKDPLLALQHVLRGARIMCESGFFCTFILTQSSIRLVPFFALFSHHFHHSHPKMVDCIFTLGPLLPSTLCSDTNDRGTTGPAESTPRTFLHYLRRYNNVIQPPPPPLSHNLLYSSSLLIPIKEKKERMISSLAACAKPGSVAVTPIFIPIPPHDRNCPPC